MSDERLRHLGDVAGQLWPAPLSATVASTRSAAGTRPLQQYLLLPSSRRPRILAPPQRRAAAAVVRHHGEGRNGAARVKSALLARALQVGVGPLLARRRYRIDAPPGWTDGDLVGELGKVLRRDVLVGMHLGAARANRKPVLQVVTSSGETLAYAKLGVDRLTDDLVRAEAAALRELAGPDLGPLRVPVLLHEGSWRGHALVVQSALPVWAPRARSTDESLHAAIRALSGWGREDGVPLGATGFWRTLTSSVDLLPAGDAPADLARLLVELHARAGDVPVSVGAAHGDWTPWNTAVLRDGVLVWDWERFRHGVPVGFDLLHHRLQTALVVDGRDPEEAAHALVRSAPDVLAALGVPAEAARVSALAYVADLATRYLRDRQHEAGAPLGDVGAWLLPALRRGVENSTGGRVDA